MATFYSIITTSMLTCLIVLIFLIYSALASKKMQMFLTYSLRITYHCVVYEPANYYAHGTEKTFLGDLLVNMKLSLQISQKILKKYFFVVDRN